ncbi:MAG: TonB-dependent receptor [Ignavibacteriae bacterium]|nr:TonB-dependent receptor [Ignavibacteriota bacterium]MCB9215610.1 TonB-dependent receptor [Ignavibacteria bacterium]
MRFKHYMIAGEIFFSLVIAPLFLQAQVDTVRTIQAIVLDSQSDEPIPGAEVQIFGIDLNGESIALAIGGATDSEGKIVLTTGTAQNLSLQIRSIGYEPMLLRCGDNDSVVVVYLFPLETFTPVAEITGVRRSRSVEDGCCRVESIREEVQQHAPFTPSPVESLRRYSSCTSGRTINTIDNAGTISLRGLEPTRVGILLDGTPLLSGLGTFFGMSLIPSHALQTIQIAEGASSGRYGNGAISGIVDLQTRVPTEEPELNVSANVLGESSSPDQYDLNAGYTGLLGDVGIALFGSFNDHALSVEDGGNQLIRDYRRLSGMVKANALLDNRTELIATLLGGVEERTGSLEQSEVDNYQHHLQLNQVNGIATLSRLVGESGEITLRGGFSRFGVNGEFDLNLLEGGQSIFYGEGIWRDLSEGHDYQVGVQARADQLEGENLNGIDYSNQIFSLFAQDVVSLGTKWTLLGSLRADQHSNAGLLLSPRGSLRYTFSDAVSMRLMAGNGFKGEATFDEDYRALIGSLRWQPNNDINYEQSLTLNYDVTWTWSLNTSIAASGNLNFYYTRIENKLVANTDSLATGTLFYQNSTEPARLIGLEWQTRASIAGGWSASIAVALIDYRLMSNNGEWERLPFSPQLNVDGALNWVEENIGLTVESWGSLIGAQPLPYEVNGRTESPVHVLLNGRVEKQFGQFALFTGVLNALDITQSATMPLVQIGERIPDGSIGWGPAEGREFFLGARMRLAFSSQQE